MVSVTNSQSPPQTIDAPYTIFVGSVAITSGNPPKGYVNVGYGDCNPGCTGGGSPLVGSGGVPPYSFRWGGAPGSSTPPGLGIGGRGSAPFCLSPTPDSEICGEPKTAGVYYVVVSISDSASPPNQGVATYRIFIQ